jgi:hypothetical protein
MTRADIINEVGKVFNVRYAWSKSYDNGTMLTEYTLYYNRRARKPLAWLQIGFNALTDEVIGADISFTDIYGERHELEIEKMEDIAEILKKVAP